MTIYCKGKGAVCDLACTNEACEHYDGTGAMCIPTVADAIRSLSDSDLVDKIEDLLPKLMEAGDNSFIGAICDTQGECDKDGNCTKQRHRACVLRFLHKPAELLEDLA